MIYPIDEWCMLDNSIVPQMFAIKGKNIYYFDKINKHEGRFCRWDKENCDFFEIDDAIGVLSKNGDMFSIKINDNTVIRELNEDGTHRKEIILEGIFYDLIKDDIGNYIFMGIKNCRLTIEIYNNLGKKIGSISPQSVVLGCGINVLEDHLFLGSIDEKNVLKIIEMNYIGLVAREWKITDAAPDQVIDKIIFYKDYLIVLLKGKVNSIVIINRINEYVKLVNPIALGLNDFIDINIYGDKIHILNDRKIYFTDAHRFVLSSFSKKTKKMSINTSIMAYQYMMYASEISRNLGKVVKPILVATIFFAAMTCIKTSHYGDVKSVKLIILLISICILLWSFVKSGITLRDRSERIDRLLEINSNISLKWISNHSYIGAIIFNIVLFGVPINISGLLINTIVSLGLVWSAGIFCIRKINFCRKDMIIDLLNDDNSEYERYIQFIISKMKTQKNEKLSINILTEDKVLNNVVANWAATRKPILKQDIILTFSEGKLTTVLDLSKRDIKYSRYSILMDYICFVKEKINIKEIEIDYFNKEI